MISAINFNKEINPDNISGLISQISSSDFPLIIYISSSGGDPDAVHPIVHYLNELNTGHGLEINLVGYGQISSAAFDLFRNSNCKKYILPDTWALVHKTKLEIDEVNKVHLEQKKVAKIQDEELYQFLKESKVISANDLKNFNQGKDIIVSYERLCKLLKVNQE